MSGGEGSLERASNHFATIEEALEDVRSGRPVVVVTDDDPSNEGDLTIAAQFATPQAVNYLVTHARALVCLCMTEARCDELGLSLMNDRGTTRLAASSLVSIEAREGVTTGISAQDRSRTILTAIDPAKGARDLVQPGHVLPFRALQGGVLQRAGRAEAAVDLARLAGLMPAGVICAVMNDDGTMARVADLVELCRRHELKLVTIADLIEYRRRTEQLVERVTSVRLPTVYGEFACVCFRERLTGRLHLALVHGEVAGAADVLVRVHSECLAGDVFHSLRCDCGEQLEIALHRLAREEHGVLVYLSQEGRGVGLLASLSASDRAEDGGASVTLADAHAEGEYGIGSQILADLGLSTIRLLTDNPKRIAAIEGFGLRVVGQEPLHTLQDEAAMPRESRGPGKVHHQGLRFDWDGEWGESWLLSRVLRDALQKTSTDQGASSGPSQPN
jgi:3,4-dihydroxy 2-butanone 4-phosphate synthase/GTP cyclohydrolase II